MSHMEFRKAGSEKFYAPERDLLHAAGPLLKSALGLTLVTNNTREFAKVPGLLLDNWVDAD